MGAGYSIYFLGTITLANAKLVTKLPNGTISATTGDFTLKFSSFGNGYTTSSSPTDPATNTVVTSNGLASSELYPGIGAKATVSVLINKSTLDGSYKIIDGTLNVYQVTILNNNWTGPDGTVYTLGTYSSVRSQINVVSSVFAFPVPLSYNSDSPPDYNITRGGAASGGLTFSGIKRYACPGATYEGFIYSGILYSAGVDDIGDTIQPLKQKDGTYLIGFSASGYSVSEPNIFFTGWMTINIKLKFRYVPTSQDTVDAIVELNGATGGSYTYTTLNRRISVLPCVTDNLTDDIKNPNVSGLIISIYGIFHTL